MEADTNVADLAESRPPEAVEKRKGASTTAAEEPQAVNEQPPKSNYSRWFAYGNNHNTGDSTKPTTGRTIMQSLKKNKNTKAPKGKTAAPLDIVGELQAGLLPVAMLKMHMDHDVKNHRRIPILLQHLNVAITETIHVSQTGHTLYRIELDIGAGLARWAVYREMRDFFSLHTFYRTQDVKDAVSFHFSNENEDRNLPSFPKGNFGHFLQWQRKTDSKEQETGSEREYREALTTYLFKLIRFVIFKPEANRLCRFFELSTLGLQMAPLASILGKQGYLKILSKSSRPASQGLLHIRENSRPKWFIVRESFIVIVEAMESMIVHDVFLFDQNLEVIQKHKLKGPVVEHSSKDPESQTGHFNHTGSTVHHYVKNHKFNIINAERKLKLSAPSEREMEQFLLSIKFVAQNNPYGKPNRFDSFAPIRRHVSAQWFVDGRDYYWNLSEAILRARERIYIHDWWLSPELYLRRPGTPEWRLDNLLKRKAEEGVHIHVILYSEVSNQFTPTDSSYAKTRLMALHPNIFVQRSPSHLKTGTFYWAHHEKLCVIDEMIAFMGGFDLCFGRYDTPTHALIDDADMTGSHTIDAEFIGPVRDHAEANIWPGQDYANERVAEWHTLNKPEQDLINRKTTPRMPWHDVGAQLIGQPARDLCRHFCQRWNMLLRNKNHTRRMFFLLPPPELIETDLDRFGIRGTCEVQICRSAGPWSLNTPKTVEHSIQNAYLKAIEQSEHFVYVENQFFVTSTELDTTQAENNIGLALVERIIRAHKEGTKWRAIIVIPLTPGFPMDYDHAESSSVRIISAFQYESISRGANSIFGRLLRAGVNPSDYIGFFSLRSWGQLQSGALVTEQIYPHDKIMIVDDRLAIIGSANINDRSQRGDRDSELACVIRDEDTLMSTMAEKPYRVGRFPHSLRMRLMREHLGVDVDAIERVVCGSDDHIGSPRPKGTHKNLLKRPDIEMDSMVDPVSEKFYEEIWDACAAFNTDVYRQVFRCVPDDDITTWAIYKMAKQHAEKLARSTKDAAASGMDVFTEDQINEMIDKLKACCGHLVQHPLHFMERDSAAGNYLFPLDHINPLFVFD
ncbi:Phospholipase D1 [Malassezia pachydermatis]|uniref:Phospholipase n=1 Tax=Malassezia pachydermatis TaxID=77020 RepID=A0A0M8MUU8_9BASI|nr:spo14-phospholipase d [Malassezia pachydermatis]KOS14784.1 spo14-phospholipase d [Malassezia pachydermatis]